MKTGAIKHAVFLYLDSMKSERIIGGWTIRDMIAKRLQYEVYPTVVLKLCKHWAVISGGRFDCIERAKSIYKFTPGCRKVAGTDLEKIPVQSLVKMYKAYQISKLPYSVLVDRIVRR